MFHFSICTQFLYSKQHKTGYFVLKNDIKLNIFNQTGAKSKFHYVNWDSVWKMRWNWYFVYKTILKWYLKLWLFTFRKQFFIISESKFNQYHSENCHFHILSYQYQIASYRFFCLDFAISPILALAITLNHQQFCTILQTLWSPFQHWFFKNTNQAI